MRQIIINHHIHIKEEEQTDIYTWDKNDESLGKLKCKSTFESIIRDVDRWSSKVPLDNKSNINSNRIDERKKLYKRAQIK